MKKLKLKKINKKTEQLFRASEVGAVFESMNENIKLLAEGQVRLETKFDGLETKFDGLETKFDGLETKVDGLETKVDGLETKVDGLETKVDGLETKVDGLETKFDGLEKEMRAGFATVMDYLKRIDDEIVAIRKELNDLKQKKADKTECVLLEKRVKNNESELDKLKTLLTQKTV